MSSASRRKGASFELDILKYVRSRGFPAERLRLAGRLDEGDVAVQDLGLTYVFEAKNEQKIDLSGYVREAEAEAVNYASARGLALDDVWGLAVVKRRNRPIGDSYVVTTLDRLLL